MLAIDYYGVSVIIAAVFAGIAGVIGAFNGRTVRAIKDNTSTNGDPRTAGQMLTDVANTVGATAEKSPVAGEAIAPAPPAETPPATP